MPGKHLFGVTVLLAIAACLIALTWFAVAQSAHDQRQQTEAQVEATLTAQAALLSEAVEQQIRVLDLALRVAATAWDSNPRTFDLSTWRDITGRDPPLTLSGDLILTDESGIIRQSSVAQGIGQRLGRPAEFRTMAEQANQTGRLFLGPPTINPIVREWHMNVVRALHRPDGSFAGVIVTDFRLTSITHALGEAHLGDNGFAALIGLADSRLRGAVTSGSADEAVGIADAPLFAVIRRNADGVWTGRSPIDAVLRVHAYRRLANQDLTVVVGMDETQAMQPATDWERLTFIAAACVTALLVIIVLLQLRAARVGARQATALAAAKVDLATLAAQLEVTRAVAEAKAEQLAAALSGMHDGLSMFDAQMCLLEWNDHFAEIAGLPADILRVGLPMEQILRLQALDGQFGKIDSPDAEVARRMVRLRTGPFGVVQRQRPDGHTIELRRKALPQGGFVTIYTDITESKRAEEALRGARAAAEAAVAAKARFLALIADDIRAALAAITQASGHAVPEASGGAADQRQPDARQAPVPPLREAADRLQSLINSMAVAALVETGGVSLQQGLFHLGRLLEDTAGAARTAAADRGIHLRVAVADGVPAALFADPRLLRQVLQTVLVHAIRHGFNGEISLTAEAGSDISQPARLVIRDQGPPVDASVRPHLFQPLNRLEPRHGDARVANNRAANNWGADAIGFSTCHELVGMLGGAIGCATWTTPEGGIGNVFWLTLPASALPATPAAAEPASPHPKSEAEACPAKAQAKTRPEPRRHRLPRSRILLVEDVVTSQIVGATLLRREGHMVDIADCGEAAVAAIQRSPYDLVFMDIMMPGMGGQEATMAIRTLSGPARSVPIIALTADVSSGDEAVFRGAGMNGALAKPVVLAELLDVLNAHAWSGRPTRATDQPAGAPPVDAAARPGLPPMVARRPTTAPPLPTPPPVLAADRILELRGNLPPETFVSLVEECLVDLDNRLPALRRAFATSSADAITAHAHAMVGMASGYGMAALEARLRMIMAATRSGELAALSPDMMTQVEADLAAATRALREMMQDVLA